MPTGTLRWPSPALTHEGQRLFWDRQALDYSNVSMTGNPAELSLVTLLCALLVEQGRERPALEDIAALGCGDGRRDPEAILDLFKDLGVTIPRTYLNDLSPRMVEQAQENTALYMPSSDYVPLVCSAAEALRAMPPLPRRVILGVYRVEGFVRAFPHFGHRRSGFDEYVANADRLGPRFQINEMHLQGDQERFLGEIRFLADGDEAHYDKLRESLSTLPDLPALDVMRVTAWRDNDNGAFFLSHWFTEAGVRRLVRNHMGSYQETTMSLVPCAKSFVLCFDPPEEPRGVVTMLNNAFGNLLPSDWGDTLGQLKETCRL